MFWPFAVWINCSQIDLKNFANYRLSVSNFKRFSRWLEHFFLIVGRNNFGNKIPFFSFQVHKKIVNDLGFESQAQTEKIWDRRCLDDDGQLSGQSAVQIWTLGRGSTKKSCCLIKTFAREPKKRAQRRLMIASHF